MLSDLFQERNLTPAPSLGTTLATAKDGGADKEVKVAGDTDEATEREIVDILMAADLGLFTKSFVWIYYIASDTILQPLQRMKMTMRMSMMRRCIQMTAAIQILFISPRKRWN